MTTTPTLTPANATPFDHLLPAETGDGARRDARTWLADHGLPTTRDEAWRYTPVAEIVARLEQARPVVATPGATRSTLDELAGDHGGPRLVFVNGVHAPELSDPGPNPAELWCGPLADVPPDRLPTESFPGADERSDGFLALNRVLGTDAAVVLVGDGSQRSDSIQIVHLAVPGEEASVSHPRTIVAAGPGTRSTIIETYCGFEGAALTNASTTIHLGSRADLTYHRVQHEAPGAYHVGRTFIEVSDGSHLLLTSVMAGAAIARAAIDVTLSGPKARADLTGIYVPSGEQRHDTVVTVDHAASHGTSTQVFKGIIADRARGSFSGRIIVPPGVVGTDADQTNHNLVLGPHAQADTRPWLEIRADDVRCNHGATVGRLDEEALFYLRSRGIPIDVGRAMLIEAFGREIIDAVTPTSLRDHLRRVSSLDSGERS